MDYRYRDASLQLLAYLLTLKDIGTMLLMVFHGALTESERIKRFEEYATYVLNGLFEAGLVKQEDRFSDYSAFNDAYTQLRSQTIGNAVLAPLYYACVMRDAFSSYEYGSSAVAIWVNKAFMSIVEMYMSTWGQEELFQKFGEEYPDAVNLLENILAQMIKEEMIWGKKGY